MNLFDELLTNNSFLSVQSRMNFSLAKKMSEQKQTQEEGFLTNVPQKPKPPMDTLFEDQKIGTVEKKTRSPSLVTLKLTDQQ
jgi:hypothetical protein